MKRAVKVLFSLFIAAALFAGGVYFWGKVNYAATGPLREITTIVIPSGTGVKKIAQILQANGVIEYSWLFVAAARLESAHRNLKAGEYAFPARVSPSRALAILREGRTVVHQITIPEGLSTPEVIALLRATPTLSGAIQQAPSEGVLLPETYGYSLGDSRSGILERMRRARKKVLADLWATRPDGSLLSTPEDVVVLASIIEKETGRGAERARIAGVFHNRLRLGMRLQSDPTVAYGVSGGAIGGLGRALTRADLSIDNPYNTYRIKGLPPGPICNPGKATLQAALAPLKSKELYFVADGAGGHVFARNLKAHNRNAAKWRRLRDAAKKP
jgi:UPF0755 protein